jgi:glycosyltransferase involved in cell wall biosynthesis
MNKEQPLVTTFTLVHYTNPSYVIEAIDSIYSQTYKNIEHIIVNDAPDDSECWPVIKKYIIDNKLPSIIIEHNKNKGICNTLNEILDLSKGVYIIGCSDDVLLPNRIIRDIELFKRLDENYAVLYSIAQYIDHHSQKKAMFFPSYGFYENTDDIFAKLLKYNPICAAAATIKVSCLKQIGGYDTRFTFEDYPLWFKLLENKFKIQFSPEITTLYRRHNESFSISKREESILECFRIQLYYSREDLDFKIIRSRILKKLSIKSNSTSIKVVNMYLEKRYDIILLGYKHLFNLPIAGKIISNMYINLCLIFKEILNKLGSLR